MGYPCANFYGSIHCHNTVTRFGDRCKLCTITRAGASVSDGLLPEDVYSYGDNRKEEANDAEKKPRVGRRKDRGTKS